MQKPTMEQVKTYGRQIGLAAVECEKFFDHFTANGWKVGRAHSPMVDWQAALRNWHRRVAEYARHNNRPRMTIRQRNERINWLNRRKAQLLRTVPRTVAIDRELARIQAELQRL
jgi:hypothetical protein